MSSSYKWLTVFSCAMVLSFLVVLKTTNVLAQVEADQSPCPSTLLWAVLNEEYDMARVLLEYGADPNASLENCQVMVTDDSVLVLTQGDQKFLDAWNVRSRVAKRMNNIADNSSLLHIAARFCRRSTRWVPLMQSRIYHLLIQHGAKLNAMNAVGNKPTDITLLFCQ